MLQKNQILQALKPSHAADLGFLHAETSIEALAEYQRIEKRRNFRMVSSRAGGLRGAIWWKKLRNGRI